MCGGEIDPESGKCTTCGAAGISGDKKASGKRVKISLDREPGKGKKKSDKKDVKAKPPGAKKKGDDVAPEDEALAQWLSGDKEEEELGEWLGGKPPEEGKKEDKGGKKEKADEKKGEKPKKKKEEPVDEESSDALKKWLSGEEDTLKDWLGDEEEVDKPKKRAEVSAADSAELSAKEEELKAREEELKKMEEEVEGQKIQMEEFKKKMESEFEKVKSGEFDPLVILEETAKLNKELQQEVKKRKQLEDEIVQVKKGSLAVIKYVKAQQMQDKGGVAKSLKKRLDDEIKKREDMETKLKAAEETLAELKKSMEEGMADLPDDAKALKEKEIALVEREKELEAKLETLEKRQKELEQAKMNGAGSEADSEMQQRMMAELAAKEQEWIETEGELKKQIRDLEEKLHEYEIDDKLREERSEFSGKSEGEINAELEKKIRELQVKEKSLLVREDEIQRLKDELAKTKEEMGKMKEPMAFKEDEMLRREEDLVYREQKLIEERRRLEEAMRESGSMEAHEMKQKLEDLQAQINKKEDELRAKEQYMQAKMEDLRIREQGLIEEEIEAREEERQMELKIEKVKIGDRRLDDLLLGGIPFGSNLLVYGPPFTGKEIVMNSFVAEGLKKGIPALWIITDKMPSEIREEMMFILSGYEEYEKMGLVKYVDAYSRGIGVDDVEPNVTYIEEATDFEGIMKAVDSYAKEYLQDHDYYRLAFRSVSTLIAYLDSGTAFKFLQPFCGKRKRERAVSMFAIEKGMHNEQDIQMIGSVTDGMIDFKLEQLKTFLSIKGIGDVQSRAWIDYSYSKQGLIIGSFSLDHIR